MKKDRCYSVLLTGMTSVLVHMIRAKRPESRPGQVIVLLALYYSIHFGTDRVLYRGKSLDLSVYSCSELKGSDHKPGTTFACLLGYMM